MDAPGSQGFDQLLEAAPAALAVLRGLAVEAASAQFRELLAGHADAVFREPRVAEALRRALETGEAQEVREVRAGEKWLELRLRREPGGTGRIVVVAADASERVTARALLEDERMRLDAVFANVSAALAIVRGPEAIFERTNQSYEALFVDRPLVGKPLLEALPELRGQKFPELISSVFRTGVAYVEREALALLRRTSEGALEERFFDQSYTQIAEEGGLPWGVLIQAVDVTERVHSRERIKAEEEKSARLLRFMPTPFVSVTSDWVLNYLNPAAEEVLGLRAEDVQGRSLWETFPGLRDSRFGEAYQRVMKEGVRLVTEDYYPDYGRWYEAWSYPFDKGLAVSFFDITQRKQDELHHRAETEKLLAIFHGSAAPMVFFRGPDLIYDMVNDKYRELVPKRDLLDKPLEVALPELAGTAFPKIIRQVFETGTPVVTHEELAPLKNPLTGELENRYFDSGVSRISDGEGRPSGVFVQATEVTERVQNRQRIEEALAARDTFLSIASHELRTPLTAMKLQAQMAQRALLRGDAAALSFERVMKLVERTDQGLSRMSRLVEDMLDIARIRGGKLQLNPEQADLAELVRVALGEFAGELEGAGIAVSLHAPHAQPVVIDRFRMEQVLTNLITNAVKYAPGAPLKVRLEDAPGRVRLVFHDGGPGVAADDRERIFERFERLGPVSQVSGLGLGLFIVRQIVEAHGGRIFVEQSESPGAKFVLELPQGNADAPPP